MDSKDRVVIERFPVDRLPDELREAEQLGAEVRIVFEPVQPEADEGEYPLSSILEEMQSKRVFSGDPVARVRALRAEGDWRDELHARIRAGDA
jgi:hypothetical protein